MLHYGQDETFEIFAEDADPECNVQLVESIPIGLDYNGSVPKTLRTFEAWQILLNSTERNLDLASSYWSLRGSDVFEHPSDWQGEWIFHNLIKGNEFCTKTFPIKKLKAVNFPQE